VGEIVAVAVAHLPGDVLDGQVGEDEKFPRGLHPSLPECGHRGLSRGIAEDSNAVIFREPGFPGQVVKANGLSLGHQETEDQTGAAERRR